MASRPPASSASATSSKTTGTTKTTRTTDTTDTSYVDMTDVDSHAADATLIGHHCEYEYCRQLDFLPFLCQSCRHTFCLDHRTESAHHCAQAGAWAARRRAADQARASAGAGRPLRDAGGDKKKPCAYGAAGDGGGTPCKTVVGTSLVPGVHCSNCNRDYCLKHRLREDHDCAALVAQSVAAAAAARNDRGRSALDKLRAWGAAKKEQANKAAAAATAAASTAASGATTTRLLPPRAQARQAAAARLAALADLKKTAKGDGKLAPEKRVYLYVEAEAASTRAKLPKGRFFYARDWVVGRVLDAAARDLQIANVNNQSANEADKLRLFHVEGGRLLDFGETAGSVLASGNTVVLLRGVGPPPSLMEM